MDQLPDWVVIVAVLVAAFLAYCAFAWAFLELSGALEYDREALADIARRWAKLEAAEAVHDPRERSRRA